MLGRDRIWSFRGAGFITGLGQFRAYLWPEKPTFLGFLIMVSIYNFLKRSVLGANGRVCKGFI